MAGIRGTTGWVGVVLGTPDPRGLGWFWAGVIGGNLDEEDETFVTLHTPGTTFNLAFQLEPDHRPPDWPGTDGQQMQLHLDIGVVSVPDAVGEAEALGARQADVQPQDDVRVMLDPAGHPFCLYTDTDD